MRPIYSSCPNKRIKLNGQSRGLKNGKYSEPPPKNSANSQSASGQLEISNWFLLYLPIDPMFSAAEFVILVSLISSQQVLLRS
jgi:hypothetical protein